MVRGHMPSAGRQVAESGRFGKVATGNLAGLLAHRSEPRRGVVKLSADMSLGIQRRHWLDYL